MGRSVFAPKKCIESFNLHATTRRSDRTPRLPSCNTPKIILPSPDDNFQSTSSDRSTKYPRESRREVLRQVYGWKEARSKMETHSLQARSPTLLMCRYIRIVLMFPLPDAEQTEECSSKRAFSVMIIKYLSLRPSYS